MSFMPKANLWRRLATFFAQTTANLLIQLPAAANKAIIRQSGTTPTANALLEFQSGNGTAVGSITPRTDGGLSIAGDGGDLQMSNTGGTSLRFGGANNRVDVGIGSNIDLYCAIGGGHWRVVGSTGYLVSQVATGLVQNTGGDKRVTSDVTVDSTTPGNITDLTVTLIAGRKYMGRLVAFTSTPTAADGLRIDFDGGAGTMTSFRAMGTVADTVSVRPLAMTTAIATDFVDTTTTGDAMTVIEFGMVVNAGGTFIPRIGKEADAGDAITLYTNSYMQIWDSPN